MLSKQVVVAAICATAIAFTGTATCPAGEAESGFYFNVDAGGNFMQDVDVQAKTTLGTAVTVPGFGVIPAGTYKATGDVKMDPGYRVSAGVGYKFNKMLSAGIESGFLYNEVKDADVWLGQVPLLATLMVEFKNDSKFVPFIGVGVGGAMTMLHIDEGLDKTEDDFVFAYQGTAGVRYMISENMSLGLAYKYFATAAQNYTFDVGASDVKVRADDIANHSVGLFYISSANGRRRSSSPQNKAAFSHQVIWRG